MAEMHLPEAWSDWTVTDTVGSGSYGTVYRAERKLKDQTFVSAVKVIQVPQESEDTDLIRSQAADIEDAYDYYRELVEDFEREIRNMDALKGITNIVSIEDYAIVKRQDRIGWNIYLRMEFLQSFTEYQMEHLMKEEDVVRLGIDICTALTYCEKAKILHRDIKPENIFVSKYGNFKLGDFGISRTLDRSTMAYTQNGTKLYMAPEILHNEKYDARADQYSLGLVLYMLMNKNRAPMVPQNKQFPGYRDKAEALQKRLDGAELPPPVTAGAGLSRIILKACEYEPDKRFRHISEMKEALEKLQKNESPRKTEPAREESIASRWQEAVGSLGPVEGNAAVADRIRRHSMARISYSRLEGEEDMPDDSENEDQESGNSSAFRKNRSSGLRSGGLRGGGLRSGGLRGGGLRSGGLRGGGLRNSDGLKKQSDALRRRTKKRWILIGIMAPIWLAVNLAGVKWVRGHWDDFTFSTIKVGGSISKKNRLFEKLERSSLDDYCYFISEEFGIYFDEENFTFEWLEDGKGSYSVLKGSGKGARFWRGEYTDDGKNFMIRTAGDQSLRFTYELKKEEGKQILEASMQNVGKLKLHQVDGTGYFAGE